MFELCPKINHPLKKIMRADSTFIRRSGRKREKGEETSFYSLCSVPDQFFVQVTDFLSFLPPLHWQTVDSLPAGYDSYEQRNNNKKQVYISYG